jgi:hypothetical protein
VDWTFCDTSRAHRGPSPLAQARGLEPVEACCPGSSGTGFGERIPPPARLQTVGDMLPGLTRRLGKMMPVVPRASTFVVDE